MKVLKFEYGEDFKEYLDKKMAHAVTLVSERLLSCCMEQYEFITNTHPPKEGDLEKFEKYEQDGIEFYISKGSIDLNDVDAIRFKVKKYESDLSGRDLEVELVHYEDSSN